MNPIANMFTRIANASRARHESVSVPYSKFKMEIIKLLQDKKYLTESARRGKKNKRTIEVGLRYEQDAPVIHGIKMISKQSQRIYGGWQELKSFRSSRGMVIVSTSKGLLSAKDAEKEKVGGEIIARIW